MKKYLPIGLSLVILMTSSITYVIAQMTTPRPASPAAKVSQTIGLSEVTITYSRPSVKGRAIWGALVPYGWNTQNFGAQNEAPWRAGANENTVLQLSHEAKIEGKLVPAGSYGLFFVIHQDNTGEVVLSKDHRSWGSFWYNPANDQVRAKIILREVPHTEILTYDFINLDKKSGELVLNWEKKQFPVKIEFAVDEIVMANVAEELKGTTGFNWNGYWSAANYSLQNKVDLERGLAWAETAVGLNRTFTTLNVKVGLLNALGRKDEGDVIMKEALAMATEPELNNYGYQLLGQGKHDEAIKVFITNTERFPASANVWDSLGEGYATKGDKKNAIKYFKKSLSLDPPANVRANSEKYLKQLGAL